MTSNRVLFIALTTALLLVILVLPPKIVSASRATHASSGLLWPLAGATLMAAFVLGLVMDEKRRWLGKRAELKPWLKILRTFVAFAFLAFPPIHAAISVELAATDRTPGTSTTPIVVITAPLAGFIFGFVAFIVTTTILGRSRMETAKTISDTADT